MQDDGPQNVTQTPVLKGYEVIHAYLKTLDGSPGVYRMLNEASEVLYVGKARSLRNRVSNYARMTGHSARIARMRGQAIASTDYKQDPRWLVALRALREAQLID